jgi:hypothetical protein
MLTIVCNAIFSLRHKRLYLIGLCLWPALLLAQGYEKIVPPDSLGKTFSDTGLAAVQNQDVPVSPSALESEVHYTAKDSIIFDMENKKAYLYGKAHIDYQNLVLDAAFITIDWTSNVICAEGMPDSAGKMAGYPVFKEGEKSYNSKSLCYNFKTKSGRITEMMTQESEEAFYHAEVSKTVKQGDKDVIFVKNGIYTTCNLHDPHFGIYSPKMKIMPNDKVITSFAYVKVEDVPLPVALPFGFFPANSRKTSGLIIPEIGNDPTRGYVLRNGGFYYGGSDFFDAALTGDIYSRGLYRVGVETNYAKRYRFNGNINVNYSHIDNRQIPETPSWQPLDVYSIQWRHSVNPKARPGTTFSADVNAMSSKYLKSTSYQVNDILNQTLASSVNYGKAFRLGSLPMNLSTSLRHTQNLSTGLIDLELPSATLSMSRITPFKGKNSIGKKWYHDLGLIGTMDMRNSLSTTDSNFQRDFTLKNFRNYAAASTPLSITIPIINYINFTPTVTASGYIYSKKYSMELDTVTNQRKVTSIEEGFFPAYSFTSSALVSTNLYGTANINRGRLAAIRHRMTPSVGLNYSPDFTKTFFRPTRTDTSSDVTVPYFMYDNGFGFPAPPQGQNASLFFSLGNNLEMKVKPKAGDTTTPVKKLILLDQFGVTGGYDLLKDSMKLSNLTFSLVTTLFEKLTVNARSTLDPYIIDNKGRPRKELEWDVNKRPGRFTSATLNLSTSLNGTPAKYTGMIMPVTNPYTGFYYNMPYANFNVPWNLSANFNLAYSKPAFEKTINKSVGLNGSFALTKNWKISGTTSYDITNKEPGVSSIDIYRDLHCWEMSMHWIPFGRYQAYFFNIRIKASTLRDLKLDKRDEWTQPDEE